MKKAFLFGILLTGIMLFCNLKTFAQVSIHVRGVIGEDPHAVYHEYPVVDQGYRGSMPPGQAKKLYGYRSAKNFAPGHTKKNDHRRFEMYKEGYEVYTAPSRPRVVINAHVRL